MLDVSRNYITLMENGAKPLSPKIAKKLASFDACMIPKAQTIDHDKLSKDEQIAALKSDLEKERTKSQRLLEIHREFITAICPQKD